MPRKLIILTIVIGIIGLISSLPSNLSANADTGTGPPLLSGGPLTFGPNETLFIADNQGASIYALEMGQLLTGEQAGTKDINGIDQQIALLLGTDAREIQIYDLAVNPSSKNTFISMSRGRGASAKPVLIRIDGAGTIDVINLDDVKYTSLKLPNPPNSDPSARRNPRAAAITDMVYTNGRLFIAGLSNEEFSSKLRSVVYPFNNIDEGTSVEIWHAAHGKFETHSPVYTFVPYNIGGEQHLIAGYLCTPLVKFPINNLKPGSKVIGTTLAELGNRNRPLDMIVYTKEGKDYLLMSNTSRGVMKIPTVDFESQIGLTERVVDGNHAGVAYETVSQMTGVEQLDMLDDQHVIVIARNNSGVANLQSVELP